MIMAVAKEFRRLIRYPQLTAALREIGMDEEISHRGIDPFIQAALVEVVSFVQRQSLRVAREAARAVEPYSLDVLTDEDVWLLFDNGP